MLVCFLCHPSDKPKHLHKYVKEKLDEVIEISVDKNKETIILGI